MVLTSSMKVGSILLHKVSNTRLIAIIDSDFISDDCPANPPAIYVILYFIFYK